jgi:hypothetical protein
MVIQHLAVVIIALLAGCYVVWRLAGTSSRLRWMQRAQRVLQAHDGKLAQRLRAHLERKLAVAAAATGCSACKGTEQ